MDKYSVFALAVIVLAISIIIIGIAVIHTYPGRVAKARRHPQAKAIEVTSLLGLLILPLWFFAAIWAWSDATLGTVFRQTDPEPQQADPTDATSPEP